MPVVNTSTKPLVFWRCFVRMDALSSFHRYEKGKDPLKFGTSLFAYLTDSLNLAPDFQRKHSRVWTSPTPPSGPNINENLWRATVAHLSFPTLSKGGKRTGWKRVNEPAEKSFQKQTYKKKILLAWKNSDCSAIPELFLQTTELFSISWRSTQYFKIKTVADGPLLRDICQKKPGSWGCYRSATLLIAAVTLLPLVRARMSDRLVPGHFGIYEGQSRKVLGRRSWITGSQQGSRHAHELSLAPFLNWVKVGIS